MKKQLLIFIACTVYAINSFAQLAVDADGKTVMSENATIDGVIGGTKAVLNVESNRLDPKYNSFLAGYSLQLVRTVSMSNNCIPYVNYLLSSSNPTPTLKNITFYVNGNGGIYSKTGLIQSSPAAVLTKNAVTPSLSSSLNKLQSLHGVMYQETEPSEETSTLSETNMQENTPQKLNSENPALEDLTLQEKSILKQIEAEKSRGRIGLIAEEVELVFPQAVRTLPDGTKGIMYSDLVAVLIEGMKELQDSLAVQADELRELKKFLKGEISFKAPANKSNIGSGTAGQNEAVLYQNTPNPFNQDTEISYRLSTNATTAAICIYNLNGSQLKKYPLEVTSLTGKITISASEFTPGMYLYALVINNQVIDSKRMTLTD